jgi:hypothetical protein
MGPKQKKSTRKFEKKHLGTEIVRRKAAKVAAQRRRAKEMRLAASMAGDGAGDIGEKEDGEEGEEGDGEGAKAKAAGSAGKKRLEDMSIDEFLNASGSHEEGDGGDDDGEDDEEGSEDGSEDGIDDEADEEEGWPEGDDDDDVKS